MTRNTNILKTLAAAVVGLAAASSHAGLVLTAAGTAGDHVFIGSPDNVYASAWNTVPAPPAAFANIYWDADNDGIFGETGIGENTGNTSGELAFNAAITSGQSLYFGMEGFAGANDTGAIEFTVQKSDLTTVRNLVHEGTHWLFADSDGSWWEATFEFNNSAYGDVVQNVSSAPGNAPADHQGVLTLTQLPVFVADATDGAVTIIQADDASPAWDNREYPGETNFANWYVDDNGDRAFENSGSTSASLAYSTPIYDGLKLEFVFESFGFDLDDVFEILGFDLRNPDGSTIADGVNMSEGMAFVFDDSNGQKWLIEAAFAANGAGGDYVYNLGINGSPGSGAADHLFTLTFNAIPTPSALPAGLGLLALAATRRRRRA